MVSQQRVYSYVKEGEKLVANKAAIDAECRQYRTDMDSKLVRLQESLDEEKRLASDEENEHRRLSASEKSLRGLLRHRTVESEKVGIYDIDRMVRSLRNVELRRLWSICRASWIRFGLPSIVTVGAFQNFLNV